VRKYADDAQPAIDPATKSNVASALDDAAREAQAIEDELAAVHKEIVLGKDLSGVGDDGIVQARELRKQLLAVQDAEQPSLTGCAAASHDRSGSSRLSQLGDRAARLAQTLAQTDDTISKLQEQGLADVATQLAREKQNLASYQSELAEHEADSRQIGTTVL